MERRVTTRGKREPANVREIALIRAIEKRPILYDKGLPEYRKAMLTEKAWEDVANAVGATRK